MWFDHKFHLQFLQDIVHTMLRLSQPFFFDFFHDGEDCKNGAQDLIYKKLRMKFHNPNCIFEEIYNIRSELLDVNHHHRINGGNIVYRHFEQVEDTGYKLVKAHITMSNINIRVIFTNFIIVYGYHRLSAMMVLL